MTHWSSDPDFTLVWPPDLFEEELRHLIRKGEETGLDSDWRNEVETLLSQAFESDIPRATFVERCKEPLSYLTDEEPF